MVLIKHKIKILSLLYLHRTALPNHNAEDHESRVGALQIKRFKRISVTEAEVCRQVMP